MAVLLLLGGIISLLIVIALLVDSDTNSPSACVIFGIVAVLCFVTPFIKNKEYVVEHKTMITNTYGGIQYNEVMFVEWDEHNKHHFWTWGKFSETNPINIKISRWEGNNDGTMR